MVRSHHLLDRFGLDDAADRGVGSYSGGMRRRVDLLAAFVVRPAVLILDEPTTGLDPLSRNEIYSQVREFVAEGTSVVLTTQYLDEADQLADRLTILDHGAAIAVGTPSEIKRRAGAGVDVVISDGSRAGDVIAILTGRGATLTVDSATGAGNSRRLSFADLSKLDLFGVFVELHEAGVDVEDIGHRIVRLDEAFLSLIAAGNNAVQAGESR